MGVIKKFIEGMGLGMGFVLGVSVFAFISDYGFGKVIDWFREVISWAQALI